MIARQHYVGAFDGIEYILAAKHLVEHVAQGFVVGADAYLCPGVDIVVDHKEIAGLALDLFNDIPERLLVYGKSHFV